MSATGNASPPTMDDVTEVHRPKEAFPEYQQQRNAAEETKKTRKKQIVLKYNYKKDQWSPLNPDGKKNYDRNFLLQLRYAAESTKKPTGLSHLPDIILDAVSVIS
jgi:hypothetical protein